MHQARFAFLMAFLSILAAASGCSGSGVSESDTITIPDGIGSDTDVGLDIDPGDKVSPDIDTSLPEVKDVLPDDKGDDTQLPDTPTCIGDPGCPCEDNGDCKTGLCIEDMFGQFCAETCVDECADEGFRCMLVLVGGEPAYYCIPRYVNLCRPCRSNSDCKAAQGTDADLCVDVGPDGSFCGASCADQPCPDGFFCQTVAIPEGGTSKQCVPAGQECACTDKYEAFNASTGCYVQNAYGTCFGQRFCGANGLTACDAVTPAKEVCNKIDDDCDGDTDEGIPGAACDLVNVWGTCPGVLECQDGIEVCAGEEPKKEECDNIDNNCNGVTDEGFPDSDENGVPDCLTDDDDEDGVPDFLDNCPSVPNPDQANWDKTNLGALGDGKGDACDEDDDNDGVNDGDDCSPKNHEVYPGGPEKCDNKDNNCNGLVDENFSNIDGDELADCVDPDIDNDGVLNELDNCPNAYNPSQVNTDKPSDNLGDACDPDDDEDGVFDEEDNCPLKKNANQDDNDQDNLGDVCDPDDDNDDVLDTEDNCALIANTSQNDFDKDGKGDVCDPDDDNDNELDETDCDDFNAAINHFAEEVCDGVDNNCKDGVDEANAKNCEVYYRDVDKDGYGTDENKCLCAPTGEFTTKIKGDCNDSAANGAMVNPGMTEICGNGLDDNCNGSQNDENAIACQYFFLDEDNDGYGINLSKCFCSQDGNYKAKQQGDCADGDPLVNPGQQEVCNNSKDDNCNGSQNDENAIGAVTFYKDEDTDYYGVTADSKKLCSAEGLYQAIQGGDCNDKNPLVNPGALERCDTAKVDEDCDSQIDEEGAEGCDTYFYDQDHDNYGVSASSKCLCEPTGNYTTKIAGDCADTNPAFNPGADDVCNGEDDDCDNLRDVASITELCGAFDESHALGECKFGQCVLTCKSSWHDVDGVFFNGCECQDDSYEQTGGATCGDAINLGDVQDVTGGQRIYVEGNILEAGDFDWFRVKAVDTPEPGAGGCDLFSFDVRFVEPASNNNFRIVVFKGSASAPSCNGADQYCASDTHFSYYTDAARGGIPDYADRGECPCSNSVVALPAEQPPKDCLPPYSDTFGCLYDPTVPNGKAAEPEGTVHYAKPNENACANNTAWFTIGVSRVVDAPVTCGGYKLEISNGVYKHH